MVIRNNIPPPSRVKQNVFANFTGKAWTSLISIIFVPIYLKLLGIEAYGLIGLYLSLMALLSVLDMGLSTTLSRELARLTAAPGNEQEARDLVRSMEAAYWGIGILVALTTFLLAPFIAKYWVNPKGVTEETIRRAVMVMGFVAGFDWPVALYTGGLMGLQRQVQLNAIRAAMATFQAVGAVLVLWLISPTIFAYFLWQVAASMAQTTLLAFCLWKNLPRTDRKTLFQGGLLLKNWRFTAGITGISVLVTLVTQTDKILLSKLLSLESFGYYILAFNVANALHNLSSPFFMALFPKFSQMVMERNEPELTALYHSGSQFLSLAILPVAVTLGVFAPEILTLWLRNPVTVENTQLLLRLILVGTMFNALMIPPYAFQLASGWTRLSFAANAVAASLVLPAIYLAASRYGAVGAAIVWITLNMGYFFLEIPFMHRRLLRGEMAKWYVEDTGLPLILALAAVLLSRAALPRGISTAGTMIWIGLTLFAAALVVSIQMPSIRVVVRQVLRDISVGRS
jgi:O-antigen/teichoic acid export membrane protein